MSHYPRIIFWKWDSSDFENDAYLDKIEDISKRSVFDFLLVALTWCKPSIHEEAAHAAIAKAAKRAEALGLKFALDIDVRPAREEYLNRHPKGRLGIVQEFLDVLDSEGKASGEIKTKPTGDHYGQYKVLRSSLLRAYAFTLEDGFYDESSLQDVTKSCKLLQKEDDTWEVSVNCRGESAGKSVLAFVVNEYSYPDIFAKDLVDFHNELLQMYADVPLAGVTIDEWGTIPYPDFDFSEAWRQPWYSPALAKRYQKETGRDILLDALNTRFAPKSDPGAQDAAINDFYNILRTRNVEIEANFYKKVKKIWGADTFVGVHPTWYAIDETAVTPEIWKNGLDWWDVKRDYGQTDEIAIFPVRLALAHKWASPIFYNMWYAMGSQDIRTYWAETWENLRFGGRTHYLGYQCHAEVPAVMELSAPGHLESVSKIEDLIILANLFQKSAAKSNVAVVFGYQAAVNWKANIKEGICWDMDSGVIPEAFGIANRIFKEGFTCDLIPSYEIEDGDLKFKDGQVHYGSEKYDALVFVGTDYASQPVREFLDTLKLMAYPVLITGAGQPEPSTWLELNGIARRDVPGGCRFQDKSVIICNQGKVNRGQRMKIRELEVNGHYVEADCEDAFGIALSAAGQIERLFAGKLSWVTVDGMPAMGAEEPEDVYIERRRGGPFKIAHLYEGKVIWKVAPNLL